MSFRAVFLTVTTFLIVLAWAYVVKAGMVEFKDHTNLFAAAVMSGLFLIGFLVDRSDKRRQRRPDQDL